jgi:hypothetical protein
VNSGGDFGERPTGRGPAVARIMQVSIERHDRTVDLGAKDP